MRAAADPAVAGPETFDPGAYTVADVLAYVDEHPDEAAAVRDAEAAGKARVTLLEALDAMVAGT
jgi:hypothetical protein